MKNRHCRDWLRLSVGLALLLAPRLTQAQFSTKIGSGEFRLDSSIQVESAWQYTGRTGGDFENVTDYYTLKAVPNLDFENFSFHGNFWLRGDQVYNLRRGDSDFKEFRQGRKFTQTFNDSFEKENIKEAYFIVRMHPFTLRAGKQQVGWGESDGIQLMDVINPIDLRREFVFRDFDETKIPLGMLLFEADLQGISPMGKLGLRDENLEFYVIPDVQGQRFLINNPHDKENGGVWGFPLPPLPPGFNVHLPREELHRNFNNAAYGGRYKFSFSGIQATLNFFHGWQNEPVSRNLGIDFSGFVLVPTPGGPVPAPIPPTHIPPAAMPGFLATLPSTPPAFGCPGFPGAGTLFVPCLSVVQSSRIDFTNRRKFVGFTLSRELTMIQLPPKNVSPVLRIEFKYEFDRFLNDVTLIPTVDGLAASPFFTVQRKDQLGYLIGLDFNLFLPRIFERRSLNTSMQFFHIQTRGNPGNLVYIVPYASWKIPKNQYYASIKLDTLIDGDRFVPDTLFVYDFSEKSFFVRQRFDFNYFGKHWRPRLEVDHLEGPALRSFGLMRDNDQVKFVLAYQF
jgi:hypothetical protein